jgi:hypothetical protein
MTARDHEYSPKDYSRCFDEQQQKHGLYRLLAQQGERRADFYWQTKHCSVCDFERPALSSRRGKLMPGCEGIDRQSQQLVTGYCLPHPASAAYVSSVRQTAIKLAGPDDYACSCVKNMLQLVCDDCRQPSKETDTVVSTAGDKGMHKCTVAADSSSRHNAERRESDEGDRSSQQSRNCEKSGTV